MSYILNDHHNPINRPPGSSGDDMDGNRYMVERKVGATRWAEVKAKLFGLPIEIIDADQELAEAAGEMKAFHKMSLADCFAAALARLKKAEIYTGDPEFKAIEAEQKIFWL